MSGLLIVSAVHALLAHSLWTHLMWKRAESACDACLDGTFHVPTFHVPTFHVKEQLKMLALLAYSMFMWRLLKVLAVHALACSMWLCFLWKNLLNLLVVWQAIQALQAATQLWREKPDKSAEEAMQGLSHFPAVMQALVQVGHKHLCSNMQPSISEVVTCDCTWVISYEMAVQYTQCQQLHMLEPLMMQMGLSWGALKPCMLLFASGACHIVCPPAQNDVVAFAAWAWPGMWNAFVLKGLLEQIAPSQNDMPGSCLVCACCMWWHASYYHHNIIMIIFTAAVVVFVLVFFFLYLFFFLLSLALFFCCE